MRKILFVVIITAFILCFSAVSSAGYDYQKDRFVLRNGIEWGMSPEDVLKLESDLYESGEKPVKFLGFDKGDVLGYQAGLYLVFKHDTLFMALYDFYDTGDPYQDLIMKRTIVNAMNNGDAEGSEMGPSQFSEFHELMTPIDDTSEYKTGWYWQYDDGTNAYCVPSGYEIWLVFENLDEAFKLSDIPYPEDLF